MRCTAAPILLVAIGGRSCSQVRTTVQPAARRRAASVSVRAPGDVIFDLRSPELGASRGLADDVQDSHARNTLDKSATDTSAIFARGRQVSTAAHIRSGLVEEPFNVLMDACKVWQKSGLEVHRCITDPVLALQ